MLAQYIDRVTIGDCLKVMAISKTTAWTYALLTHLLISRKSTHLIKTKNHLNNILIGAGNGLAS